jgi:hypothetical protein
LLTAPKLADMFLQQRAKNVHLLLGLLPGHVTSQVAGAGHLLLYIQSQRTPKRMKNAVNSCLYVFLRRGGGVLFGNGTRYDIFPWPGGGELLGKRLRKIKILCTDLEEDLFMNIT